MHPHKPKPCYIIWNEPMQASASMPTHTRRNICASIKQATSPHWTVAHWNWLTTETDIDTQQAKAWTAIDRLSVEWKSDLTDKMKRSFFQAAVVSILLYGWTSWTLTVAKKLDGNYTKVLQAILYKSWRQHPIKQQLYDHLPPVTKTIEVRRTRHAWHCWRS